MSQEIDKRHVLINLFVFVLSAPFDKLRMNEYGRSMNTLILIKSP